MNVEDTGKAVVDVPARPDQASNAAIQALPAVGMGTMLATIAWALSPAVAFLLPLAQPGDGGIIDTFKLHCLELGRAMAVPSLVPAALVFIGLAVGIHVVAATAWMRAVAALSAGLLAAPLGLIGVQAGWLVGQVDGLWIVPVAMAVGGGVGIPLNGLASDLGDRADRFLPGWLGSARALLWIPVAVGVFAVLVYLIAAAVVAVLYALAIAAIFAILWAVLKVMGGASAASDRSSDSPSVAQARAQLQRTETQEAQCQEAEARTTAEADRKARLLGMVDTTHSDFWSRDEFGSTKMDNDGIARHYDKSNKEIGRSEWHGDDCVWHLDNLNRLVGRSILMLNGRVRHMDAGNQDIGESYQRWQGVIQHVDNAGTETGTTTYKELR